MSLILDALNRADHQRSEENGTLNLHVDPSSPAQKKTFPWIILLIVSAVLVLVFFLYLLVRPSEQPAHTQNDSDAPMSAPSFPPPLAQKNKPVSSPLKSKTTKIHSSPIPAPTRIKTPQTTSTQTASTQATGQAQTPSSHAAISALYQQRNDAKNNYIHNRAKPENSTAENTYDPNSILKSIPLLSEFSFPFQRSVPSIEYNLHVYADANAGFVNLNGNRYRVGGQVVAGLRIIAILEDSLVLEYNNRQFRLIALNSWINFN